MAQSFIDMVAQANAVLAQRQQEQDQMNSGLVGGQQNVNDQTGALAAQMAAQPVAQHWGARPQHADPALMAQVQALMQMGPQQYNGPSSNLAAARHMNTKYRNDYIKQIGDLTQYANLVGNQFSDQEMQAQQDQANLAHMGAAQQLLAGGMPRQVNDTGLLGEAIKGSAVVSGADAQGQGELARAALHAQAITDSQKIQSAGDIKRTEIETSGKTQAELAKQQQDQNKEIQGQIDKDVGGINSALTGLQTAASEINDALIKSSGPGWTDKIPYFGSDAGANSPGRNLLTRLDGAINASREAIYGKGNFEESSLAKNRITDPEQVRSVVLDTMTDNMLKLEVSTGLSKMIRTRGINITPGSKEYGDLVNGLIKDITPKHVADIRTKVLQQNPALLPPASLNKTAAQKALAALDAKEQAGGK